MPSIYRQASFLTSAAKLSQAPRDDGYEVAFAGRSNAGKSSALNTLCQQKALARTSKTPGRTQLLNFFELDPSRRLVDLPGYGFAKVAEKIKAQWQLTLADYISKRACLKGMVLLMDIRHPLQPYDEQLIEWNLHYQLPLHILLSKSDKLKRGAAKSVLLKLESRFRDQPGVSIQLFSALKRQGVDELEQVLDHWFDIDSGKKEGSRA